MILWPEKKEPNALDGSAIANTTFVGDKNLTLNPQSVPVKPQKHLYPHGAQQHKSFDSEDNIAGQNFAATTSHKFACPSSAPIAWIVEKETIISSRTHSLRVGYLRSCPGRPRPRRPGWCRLRSPSGLWLLPWAAPGVYGRRHGIFPRLTCRTARSSLVHCSLSALLGKGG